MQRVHIDTVGPIAPADVCGRKYMLSAFDDKT